MKNRLFLLFIGFLFIGNLHAQVEWPDGKKSAVVLTYDDGLKSQYEIVIPQLEKKHFRGTFFLYGLGVEQEDIPYWIRAAKKGHEIGNHSIYHPCLAKKNKKQQTLPCHDLECYSVKGLLTEIKIMNTFLYTIDGKKIHSYAYPCGKTTAGGEDYSVPLSKTGIVDFARGGSDKNFIKNEDINFFKTPTYAAHTGAKAKELIAQVKKGIKEGGLTVFVFHGVGGDYLTVDAEEHQKLLDYLDKHSKKIWVTTYSKALKYLSEKKQ